MMEFMLTSLLEKNHGSAAFMAGKCKDSGAGKRSA
jgi:hypothetical protein